MAGCVSLGNWNPYYGGESKVRAGDKDKRLDKRRAIRLLTRRNLTLTKR
jgi:hypothetical protein